MSVLTPKRVVLSVVALFISTAALAGNPSSRAYARMAFDAKAGYAVLFGGESAVDAGATRLPYDSGETWIWTGSRWVQLFPLTTPPARSAHGMVYDSNRDRIVLFGGRRARSTPDGEITLLNDTWVWKDGNWREIQTPAAPDARHLFALTFDPVRDRVILFGGVRAKDAETFEAVYDTWEFDGTTWTKVDIATEPKVSVPLMAHDATRNQTLLMGADDKLATLMYAYEPDTHSWKQLTPEKMPTCANDAALTYRARSGTVILTGGLCSIATIPVDQTWEWNGTNWTEVTTFNPSRATAQAAAYDSLRDTIVQFGGYLAFQTIPQSSTTYFNNGQWKFAFAATRPTPRSLATFTTDPIDNTLWLFGGLNDGGGNYLDELWGYKNGQWFSYFIKDAPLNCIGPLSAFDKERGKLVVTCSGSEVFEFQEKEDGSKEWKVLDPKDAPTARRFAALVYDENLKKIVLFGGYDGSNYRNDTWTWDGTNWTEVKKNKPTARALMAMWYDPLAKKTIFYGGLGRKDLDERITRFTDMWSFDGTGWTKLTVTDTPGERFGAQIAIDPRDNKLILFGGLRSELISEDVRRQFFDNDMWRWDGSANTWTRLTVPAAPPARENGSMAWDPVSKELILYGGYAGFYYSDTWSFDGQTWKPRGEALGRRRAAGGPSLPTGPSIAPPDGE